MRRFEIIDRDAFIRDIPNGNYDDVVLPKRNTISSAGYDFYSVISVTLKPGERKVIPTGIRVMMNNNEFLGIFIRSSLGFKYNVRMCNQVGIIDADYYGNSSNGGHIFVCLENEGDEIIEIKSISLEISIWFNMMDMEFFCFPIIFCPAISAYSFVSFPYLFDNPIPFSSKFFGMPIF